MFSFLTILLKITRNVLLALVFIPIAIKSANFVHNLIDTIDHTCDSLKTAENQIKQLQKMVDEIKEQMTEQSKILQEQTTATMDIQQKLIDQNMDAIDTSKQIEEVYECLDLLDDRLLELVKYEKTRKNKKQVKKENRGDKVRNNSNEEILDQFIAEKIVSVPDEKTGKYELKKLFRKWCEEVDLRTYISEVEFEEYMFRNFHIEGGGWMGIKIA